MKSMLLIFVLLCTSFTVYAEDKKPPRKKPARPDFATLDLNADQQLDLEEFKQRKIPQGDHQKLFETLDKNQDGFVSLSEFNKYARAKR